MKLPYSLSLKSSLIRATKISEGKPIHKAYLLRISTHPGRTTSVRIITYPKRIIRNNGKIELAARKNELIGRLKINSKWEMQNIVSIQTILPKDNLEFGTSHFTLI